MKVVVAHNFYQQAGGEDQVYHAEVALLRECGHDVVPFEVHNDAVAGMGKLGLAKATVWNGEIAGRLGEVVRRERADVVHFHNTFPLISPAGYYAARRAGAAVVQTLHNFRLMCPVALFYRDGRPCEDCLGKPVAWPGVVHACYRGSRATTAVTAAAVAAHRAAGTFQNAVDAYVCLTGFARDQFVAGGLPPAKLHVKPNFVHPDPGVRGGGDGSAVFVGRLSEEKGVLPLLAAWAHLERAADDHRRPARWPTASRPRRPRTRPSGRSAGSRWNRSTTRSAGRACWCCRRCATRRSAAWRPRRSPSARRWSRPGTGRWPTWSGRTAASVPLFTPGDPAALAAAVLGPAGPAPGRAGRVAAGGAGRVRRQVHRRRPTTRADGDLRGAATGRPRSQEPPAAAALAARGPRCTPRCMTTSWDDGHPLDHRLAELLTRPRADRHVLRPAPDPERDHGRAGRAGLADAGFEVGAHTLNHVFLDGADDATAEREIAGSRRWVQDVTGAGVPDVLPARREVRRPGAAADPRRRLRRPPHGRADVGRSPRHAGGLAVLPTTVQAHPHGRGAYLRNAAQAAVGGQPAGVRAGRGTDRLGGAASAQVDRVGRAAASFHLWGHVGRSSGTASGTPWTGPSPPWGGTPAAAFPA